VRSQWVRRLHSSRGFSDEGTLYSAWDAYAPQHRHREIVARWGGWTMRSNKRTARDLLSGFGWG
jgi:hypothetical protein